MRGRAALRRWYRSRSRAYPWRGVGDPYRVLVSEVMLQQTQAWRVVPAYRAFVGRFPTVRALAEAERGDVVRQWSGLGYNRRAVRLHQAAGAVVEQHDGRVPTDVEALLRLPGVGPYTAGAVASMAFGFPLTAVDTNVARVVRRFMLGRDDAEARAVADAARAWIDPRTPGEWNQAVMDLGREVCRSVPRCEACPLARGCAFRRAGRAPSPARRRQPRFEGSSRQLRGAIVRVLRERRSVTVRTLADTTDRPVAEIGRVVAALADEGILSAGPAALAGRPGGRVRL